MKSLIVATLAVSALGLAQTTPNKYTIPLTDPTRPARVHVESVNGSITVETHAGKDVILEVTTGSPLKDRGADAKGMKRFDLMSGGLEAEERNNQVKIESGSHAKVDMRILVPPESSVKAELVGGGDLKIEGVMGSVEAECVNCKTILTNLGGAVTVESVNGGVQANLPRLSADKPVAITSVNGPIDLSLPADIKARVRLRSENGSVQSDFDLKVDSSDATTTANGRDKSGRFRLRLDRSVYGSINGGGTEVRLETVNGPIILRKK